MIAEMREMIALGWEQQEACDKYDAFVERLNGDGDLTEGLTKDEILALWKAANEAQAEEIAEHFDLATRDDIRTYIGSLEESGMKYSREKWADIIREEAADLDSKLSFAEEAAILDALEEDGFFLNVYMVQEGPRSGNGDYFPEEFEEKAAALDRAATIWGRLTAEERMKTTVEVIANGGTGITVWKDGNNLDAGRKALDLIGFTEMSVETAMNDDTLTYIDGRDGKTYAWALAEHDQSAVDVESLRELTEKEIEDILC